MGRRISLVAAIVMVSVMSIASSTPTSAATKDGDWSLVVSTTDLCDEYDDPAWCGPTLTVRIPSGSASSGLAATHKFTGPTGVVKLDTISEGYTDWWSGGVGYTDPDFWGLATQSRAATSLPRGSYVYEVTFFTKSRWSCSIYNPGVCSWISGWSKTFTYKFTWSGSRVQVKPFVFHEKSTYEAKVTVSKRAAAKIKRNGKWYKVTVKATASATRTRAASGTGYTKDAAVAAADKAAEKSSVKAAKSAATKAAQKKAKKLAKKKALAKAKTAAKKAKVRS